MMKKLISAVLALVLTVSFGVTAFAAEVGEGEHSTSVFANYDPDVITVDLEWGSMQFEYFDGLKDRYGESWVPVEETNRIYVKNTCPNTAIAVSYTFKLVDNAEELGVQDVYYDWNYETWRASEIRNGVTADDTDILVPEARSSETGRAYAIILHLNLHGAPTKALENVKIGDVILTISEYE